MEKYLIELLEESSKKDLLNFIEQYDLITAGESNKFKVKFKGEYYNLDEAEEIIDYIYQHNLLD